MANKMLIDAAHPEETRVVVLRGNRVHEFDFESASRKQLRGNIYLAKVTRVEPSLQAAFVDYGGNRHGFLAFSEIHPDYYQIPVADRQALIEAERREIVEADERRGRRRGRRRRGGRRPAAAAAASQAAAVSEAAYLSEPDPDGREIRPDSEEAAAGDSDVAASESRRVEPALEPVASEPIRCRGWRRRRRRGGRLRTATAAKPPAMAKSSEDRDAARSHQRRAGRVGRRRGRAGGGARSAAEAAPASTRSRR